MKYKFLLIIWILATSALVIINLKNNNDYTDVVYPKLNPKYHTTYTVPYTSEVGDDDVDDSNIQVPIPKEDRVFNKTGIQCVWASIETLGRYAKEPKLIDLTENPECKSYSSPSSAGRMLKKLDVKFEQDYDKDNRSLLIKGCSVERRGTAFGVPGHMMTMVHYSEQEKIVKFIDNSDRQLRVQTWTLDHFNSRWDGWSLIIYADNDIIPYKYNIARQIKIQDPNGDLLIESKDYIPIPKYIKLK